MSDCVCVCVGGGGGVGSLCGEVQYIMDNGHVGPPPPNRTTDTTKTLPSHNFVGGR